LTQCIDKFDSHKWRTQKLWNYECDLALKRGFFTLKQAYMSNIGKMATPGEKKYMSIAEFEQLISQADIFSENLNSSQVTLCYNLAM